MSLFFSVKLLFDVVLHSHGLTTVGFLLLHYHPYVKERFTRLLCISFLCLFVESWSASRVPTMQSWGLFLEIQNFFKHFSNFFQTFFKTKLFFDNFLFKRYNVLSGCVPLNKKINVTSELKTTKNRKADYRCDVGL